ncbi:MAG: response regulator [Gammaproteobacteria bacterium]
MNTERVILLVEDNPSDVELTRRALARKQIDNEMLVARDGEEALEMLLGVTARNEKTESVMRPAVILLDLNLPKIGGLEVLRRLRAEQETRLIPVVVLTTSNEERDISASYALGANSYIRKSIDFMAFADTIAQLGRYWLTINEPPPQGT